MFMRVALIALLAVATFDAYAASDAPARELLRRNVQFEQVSRDDGLSHEMVYAITQDRQGFVWIATQEGLARFDGYDIRTFAHLRSNPRTISNDFVRTVFADDAGHVWVGTEAGVDRHIGHGEGFERAPFAELDVDGALAGSIRAIEQTADGAFWFGTAGGGLVRVDADGAALRHFVADGTAGALPDDTILALHEDSRGTLWIGTQNAGLWRHDAALDGFVRPPALAAHAELAVRAITEDDQGRVWIGTEASGALAYDTARDTLTVYRHDPDDPGSIPDDRVRDILEDARGALWFATDAGLAEWRGADIGFVTYHHSDGDARSLATDRTNALFVDASSTLWIGTWEGISRWNYLSDTFTYFTSDEGQLPGDWVIAVDEDASGAIWVATYGDGLARLDPATGATDFYRHDASDPTSIPDDRVMAVHVDARDRVWIGTRSAGIARLDRTTGDFLRLANDPSDPTSLSGNAVTSILSDSRGDLWIGTFGTGLNRLPGGSGNRFEHFRTDTADASSISGDRVLTMLEDAAGRLWIGTEGDALNRYDPDSGRFERYTRFAVEGDAQDALALDTVTDLLIDEEGALWIATLGQGLLHWSAVPFAEGTARVEIFDKSRGMPADAIYGLLDSDDSAVWASSNRGLTRLDPRTGNLRQFDDRNGLKDSEFNGARLHSASDHLWFGGPTGLVRFLPDELPFNDRAPQIVVTASSRERELVTSGTADDVPTVRITYLDPFLAFDFAALDFVSPDKNQYRYRLEGFDPDWIYAGRFRRATYSNIPAGRYTFTVQASNNDGIWSAEGASIDVVAVPAPWNSLWAYALYVLLALLAVGLYLRAQREKLEQESRQRVLLEEQVEQRTRELAESNRDLHRLNDKLEEAAVTDSLTGLRNRRYADQFIANDISKFEREQLKLIDQAAERGEEPPTRAMFFMMIDLDGFKAINDHFGHHSGDQALLQVRDILLRDCRTSDTIIRWGGDEFLIVGVASDFTDVKILAERIRENVDRHTFVVSGGNAARLSTSIGIAPYPLVPERYSFCSWELVSSVADQASYVAKASGRNGWVSLTGNASLSPDMLTGLSDRVADLVADGHLTLETSIDGELKLVGGQIIDRVELR